MFSKKAKEPFPDFSDVKVKLKPVFGIKPGIYLTVLYAVLLLIILFFIFVYDGIVNNGIYYEFITRPDNTGVWVDGQYRGSTPCEIFVSAGEHTIELRRTFYESVSLHQNLSGPVIGSLVFPRKEKCFYTLDIEDFESHLNKSADDFFQWGMQSRFLLDYQFPPILSELAKAVQEDKENKEQIYQFLEKAVYYIDSREELFDLLKAIYLTECYYSLFSSNTLTNILKRINQFIKSYDSFVFWLINILPSKNQIPEDSSNILIKEMIMETEWFSNYFESYKSLLEELSQSGQQVPVSISSYTLMSINFRLISSGILISGRELSKANIIDEYFPYPVYVPEFYLSVSEITNQQFQSFIKENPDWSKTNTDRLVLEGKVTENYLEDWNQDNFPEGKGSCPVVNISYFSAKAFCEWLTKKLPSAFKEYSVRLPYDFEWYWATGDRAIPEDAVFKSPEIKEPSDSGSPNSLGIINLYGNVWEWCENSYFPVQNLLFSFSPEENNKIPILPAKTEKTVLGGCWDNERSEISYLSKGSQPPGWCTPWLGFRVVIAQPLD